MGYVQGIDVSHYQGTIDWAKVAAAGIKFAYLKATEGVDTTDEFYARNRAAAKAHGILTGSYHFYHYDQAWGPQATHFCGVVGSFAGELPPMLDLEQDKFRNHKILLATPDATRQTLAWLNTIQGSAHKTPGVYCDPNFRQTFLQDAGFGKYLLWEASLSAKAPTSIAPWKALTFWQWCWNGTCPGIAGHGCDLDRYTGTLAQLQKLAKG